MDKKYINTGNKDTRGGFGAGLDVLGNENPNVVAICADLTGSVKMDNFAKAHPDRFYQAGIAEANMIGVGAGMAVAGKVPFVGSFAAFAYESKLFSKKQLPLVSNRTFPILVRPLFQETKFLLSRFCH